MSLNTVVLMGRLCFDPELRKTQSNVSVTKFAIAVDRKYTPQGEEKKADFIDVQAWRGTADFVCKYFRRGQLIAVEGELHTDNYTDKDGNNRKSVYVVASNVSFCGSKDNGAANDGSSFTLPTDSIVIDGTDEDLPF